MIALFSVSTVDCTVFYIAVVLVMTDNPGSEWIEIDLGTPVNITGVVTQGISQASQWVTAFKVEYGTSSGSRRTIRENSQDKVR